MTTLLFSCANRRKNTLVNFENNDFNSIHAGMTREEVESHIGSELFFFTHVIFSDGSGNNYDGIKIGIEDARKINYVGVYSKPLDEDKDYLKYKVFYNLKWQVVLKEIYKTE